MVDYDSLRDEFNWLDLNDSFGNESSDKLREGLSVLVDKLHSAHSEGFVESVEGLPSSDEVLKYDRSQCHGLIEDVLKTRYFPSEDLHE